MLHRVQAGGPGGQSQECEEKERRASRGITSLQIGEYRRGETRVPASSLAHRDDSVLLLTEVQNLGEVCGGRGMRANESGLCHVKFRRPWDTQGKICHLATHPALRRGEV